MKRILLIFLLLPFASIGQQSNIAVPTFDFVKASKQAYVLPEYFDPIDREEQAIEGMKLGATVMTLGLVALASAYVVANVDNSGNTDTAKLVNGLALGGSGLAAIGAVGFTISLGKLQNAGRKERLKKDYNPDDIIRN